MLSMSTFRPRPAHWPYRAAAAIVAVNNDGMIAIGKCRGFSDIWKMPQGGIEAGESPVQAAVRELQEETGIAQAEFRKQARQLLSCEYPDGSNYMQGFRGQTFQWFMADVFAQTFNPARFAKGKPDPEFIELKWATPREVLALAHNENDGDHVTLQRRDMYRAVLIEFKLGEANAVPRPPITFRKLVAKSQRTLRR